MTAHASEHYGENIRQMRLVRGLSVRQLATKAGVGYGNLSDVERATKPASPQMVERLAQALDVTVEELYSEPECKHGRLQWKGAGLRIECVDCGKGWWVEEEATGCLG